MKCTNCGKNNAVYHYCVQINGQTREAHLCPECAGKLQPEREFASESRSLLGDFFSRDLWEDFFDPRPAPGLAGGLLSPLLGSGFFGPFALTGAPRIEISFPDAQGRQAPAPQPAEDQAVDPELAKMRRINELRSKMHDAAQMEDYETAARLRDQLKKLESGGNE